MEYYIISFFISIVIFVFVYLYDYKSVNNDNYNGNYNNGNVNYNYDVNGNEDRKPLFTTNNILLFVIIYIVSTIISFYTFTSSISLSGLYNLCPIFLINLFKPPQQAPPLIKDNGDGDEIDPKILSKITDTIDIGFTPPEENDDKSS